MQYGNFCEVFRTLIVNFAFMFLRKSKRLTTKFLLSTFRYLAGLLKIISNSETKGLNTFVGTFALPALIFLSLVELNWRTVNWTFLLAILISKGIVFFAVVIISLLVTRPLNYGRAGILATFCTQSNDFAIGYPIVMALYQKTHPEYASALYLMAPISLAILNPIGCIMMEISKMNGQTAAAAAIAGGSGGSPISVRFF